MTLEISPSTVARLEELLRIRQDDFKRINTIASDASIDYARRIYETRRLLEFDCSAPYQEKPSLIN